MVKIWNHSAALPRGIMKVARDTEEKGWDGLSVVDSQNLSGDPYVSLAMAATVTERIGLGTSVTNSVTRVFPADGPFLASAAGIPRWRISAAARRG
jgi:alkanesulfonate monooxygenase SsuD/methylene tetrahydromethanopterin reductase-like flavin-dependent oxidoreductase (luciferase family)